MTVTFENYRRGDECDMCVADVVVHVHTSTSATTLRGTVHLHREGHTPDGEWTLYGHHPFHPPAFRYDARRLLGEDGYDALHDVTIDQHVCDALWPPEEDPAARADREAYQQHLIDEHLARFEDRYGP